MGSGNTVSSSLAPGPSGVTQSPIRLRLWRTEDEARLVYSDTESRVRDDSSEVDGGVRTDLRDPLDVT